MEKNFKYETHMHTSESSACGKLTGAEMAIGYKELGYSGIIITDHFFNGNSAVPRKLPWEERINLFCKGYDNALLQGNKIGLKVFFGWEFNDKSTEFLTYGLDKSWLINHPDILQWDLEFYFKEVHAGGGFISHAHPFRQAPYIPKVRLFSEGVDAVEIINTSHTDPSFNVLAAKYAMKNNLLTTSGSDSHFLNRGSWGGMEFSHELNSIEDFISAVKSKSYKLLGE